MNREANNPTPRPLPCWWMLGGVVAYKLCDRGYDCEHCPFDEGLRRAERKPAWKDPAALFFDKRHVWADVEEEGSVRTGLDDFGQQLLGRIYSVRLPAPGTSVKRGEPTWSVTHQAGETVLVSPVTGVLKETNQRLLDTPSLLNREPYGGGWALVIEPSDLSESLKALRYGERARSWAAAETHRLHTTLNKLLSVLPADPGVTLPDGGAPLENILHACDGDTRRSLIACFFPVSSDPYRPAGGALFDPKRR